MIVTATRRIAAPAAEVFGVLADPARHVELDGSGMLRGAVDPRPITGVGEMFVMRMHFARLGDYEMNNLVVAYAPDRRIGWAPAAGRGHPADGAAPLGHRWIYDLRPDGPDATVVEESYDLSRAPASLREDTRDGQNWLAAMHETLARLAKACGSPG